MGLYDHWPYTNFHELNLSWLLRRMEDLSNVVENFVALNTIKYADPIQWNITSQYEPNTVVVDPQTGTAYISSRPVPAGVALTNTDYWSVIFTLDVISANKNITLRDDGSNVLATFSSVAGDWLLWNGTLYKVSQAINVNEAYVVGYNLDRYTVEMFITDYVTSIKNDIGDLTDLDTTDKDSIVNAINELVNNIGDLNDLTTISQSSIVNSINEVDSKITNLRKNVINVLDYGAVNERLYYNKADNLYYKNVGFTERPTSSVQAFTDAFAAARTAGIHTLYVPCGWYYLPGYQMTVNENDVMIKGEGPGTYLVSENLNDGEVFITVDAPDSIEEYGSGGNVLENLTLMGNYYDNIFATARAGKKIAVKCFGVSYPHHRKIDNVNVFRFDTAYWIDSGIETYIKNCAVILNNCGFRFVNSNTYVPDPLWIEGCEIGANVYGILAPNGGYSCLFVKDCGIGSNRMVYAGKCAIYLDSCRMELGFEECCDDSGTSVYPWELSAGWGATTPNGNTSVTMVNCELLSTLGGANSVRQMWSNAPVFVRNNPYTYNSWIHIAANLSSEAASQVLIASLTNCRYSFGSYKVEKVVFAEVGRVSIKGCTSTQYNGRISQFGDNIIQSGYMGIFSPLITDGGGGNYACAAGNIDIDVPMDAHAFIFHCMPTADFTFQIVPYHDSQALNSGVTTSMASNPTNSADNNIGLILPPGTNKVRLIMPACTFAKASAAFEILS